VDKFFHTLTIQPSESLRIFTRQIRKQLKIQGGRISEREIKHSPGWLLFLVLLAKPEFQSHLVSWRVVFRTPELAHWIKPTSLLPPRLAIL
jgi:hypothetical protein